MHLTFAAFKVAVTAFSAVMMIADTYCSLELSWSIFNMLLHSLPLFHRCPK